VIGAITLWVAARAEVRDVDGIARGSAVQRMSSLPIRPGRCVFDGDAARVLPARPRLGQGSYREGHLLSAQADKVWPASSMTAVSISTPTSSNARCAASSYTQGLTATGYLPKGCYVGINYVDASQFWAAVTTIFDGAMTIRAGINEKPWELTSICDCKRRIKHVPTASTE
jgi:hypothetical protein